MKKIVLVPNPKKDIGFSVTERVIGKLSSLGLDILCDQKYAMLEAFGVTLYTELPSDADAIVVIGGDGSVIDASTIAVALDIPLLGINLGKVGYLSVVDSDAIDVLDSLVSGEYKVEDKFLLSAGKIDASGCVITCEHKAVNDVVISHDNYLGISDILLENSTGDKLEYRADGVIVSTPVGSTAYSLSTGGPIISHSLDSISVTPICPHSFFSRTIVYAPSEEIIITNNGDNALNISVDGRFFDKLSCGESCAVYKSNKRLKMIVFSENNMFSVLFKKIKVLEDKV